MRMCSILLRLTPRFVRRRMNNEKKSWRMKTQKKSDQVDQLWIQPCWRVRGRKLEPIRNATLRRFRMCCNTATRCARATHRHQQGNAPDLIRPTQCFPPWRLRAIDGWNDHRLCKSKTFGQNFAHLSNAAATIVVARDKYRRSDRRVIKNG